MAKSGKIQKKYRLTIAAIVAAVVLLAVGSVAIVVAVKVDSSLDKYYFQPVKQAQEFEASIPLGISMEEVREIHGDPDSIILPLTLSII
jgi:hypothetical protein